MLTFSQFVDEVDRTLWHAIGDAAATIARTEPNVDEVEWRRGSDAVVVARHHEAGVVVAPYHLGRRRGTMQVVPRDAFGVHDVCALIIQHIVGGDPAEVHF